MLESPKVVSLKDTGGTQAANGQLADSALFDAVAMVLMPDMLEKLKMYTAACGCVTDTFPNLQAFGHCKDSKALLDYCNRVVPNDGIRVTLQVPFTDGQNCGPSVIAS